MSAILEEIRAERARQIAAEGWTVAHDDEHGSGELLHAAVAYYVHAKFYGTDLHCAFFPACMVGVYLTPIDYTKYVPPMAWPFDPRWWKPKSPRRDLIRSGALALAEAERLQRAGRYDGHAEHRVMLAVTEIGRIGIRARAQ